MQLEICLLGQVSITVSGACTSGEDALNPQARLAFAMLTLERGRGVTRDALANAVWPHELPSTWASALRSVISRVRAFVDVASGGTIRPVLVAAGGAYRLQLPSSTIVDAEIAEQQLQAASRALADRRPEEAE